MIEIARYEKTRDTSKQIRSELGMQEGKNSVIILPTFRVPQDDSSPLPISSSTSASRAITNLSHPQPTLVVARQATSPPKAKRLVATYIDTRKPVATEEPIVFEEPIATEEPAPTEESVATEKPVKRAEWEALAASAESVKGKMCENRKLRACVKKKRRITNECSIRKRRQPKETKLFESCISIAVPQGIVPGRRVFWRINSVPFFFQYGAVISWN